MSQYTVHFDAHVSIIVEAVSEDEAISIGVCEVEALSTGDMAIGALDDDRYAETEDEPHIKGEYCDQCDGSPDTDDRLAFQRRAGDEDNRGHWLTEWRRARD